MMDKGGQTTSKDHVNSGWKRWLPEHLHHLFQWVVQLKFSELSFFIYFAKLELVLVEYKR